jgi:hypothetical protein
MIYIQSNTERSRPHHFDVASAMFGAIETGQDYRLTTFDEVQSGKFNLLIKNNLFVGSVEFMKEVFSKVNKEDIRVPENSNREFRVMTLGEIKGIVKETGISYFIKPFDIKLFTGFVLDQMIYTSISDIPDNTAVMVYDVFKSPIKSEFRCYIHRNKVVDIRNYSGDLFCTPNEDYLNDVIKNNSDKFPIAYTVDIGILENGENVVVEYNDMWAIGNYGMPNDLYLRLLKDRYFEIIKVRS